MRTSTNRYFFRITHRIHVRVVVDISKEIFEISKTGNTLVLVDRIETGKMLQLLMPESVFVSGEIHVCPEFTRRRVRKRRSCRHAPICGIGRSVASSPLLVCRLRVRRRRRRGCRRSDRRHAAVARRGRCSKRSRLWTATRLWSTSRLWRAARLWPTAGLRGRRLLRTGLLRPTLLPSSTLVLSPPLVRTAAGLLSTSGESSESSRHSCHSRP